MLATNSTTDKSWWEILRVFVKIGPFESTNTIWLWSRYWLLKFFTPKYILTPGVTMTSARITYCETQWVLKFYTSAKNLYLPKTDFWLHPWPQLVTKGVGETAREGEGEKEEQKGKGGWKRKEKGNGRKGGKWKGGIKENGNSLSLHNMS